MLLDFNGTLSLDEALLESCYHRALIDCGLNGLGEGEYAGLLGLSEIDISTALLPGSRAVGRGPDRRIVGAVGRGLSGGLPGALVTIEDVAYGKPHPETFYRALDQLGVRNAAHVVVCEDSAAGVAAGRAVGAITIGVGPITGSDRAGAREADYRVGSLAALLRHL